MKREVKPLVVLLAVLLLAAVPFAVYGNSLASPFVGDDIAFIKDNNDVKDFSFPGCLGKLRFLNKFSYWVNLKVFNASLSAYHLVNISLHALTGILLLFLFWTLLSRFAPEGAEGGGLTTGLLAFFGALLFEVHPIHTQAVNYTFARSELFCAVFLFSALLLHARDSGSRYGLGRGILVSLFLLLALASKERAFMFVPALVLFDLFLRRKESMPELKRRWLRLVIPMSLVVIFGLVNFYIGFQDQHQGAIGEGQEVPRFLPYFLAEMTVRLHYLKLYFWPFDLSFDYNFTLHESLAHAGLLAAIGCHLLLVVLAVLLRRKDGRLGFGIFWFFLLALPTAGIVPAALLMHEHWIYVPSFGVFLTMLSLIQWLITSRGTQPLPAFFPKAFFAVLFGLSVLLAFLSFDRNRVWHSSIALWEDASLHAPERPWVWNNLGAAYLKAGMPEKALPFLEKAEKMGEATSASRCNIGLCHMEMGELDKARECFFEARRMDQESPAILIALAELHRKKGKLLKAFEYYCKAADRDPQTLAPLRSGKPRLFMPDLFIVGAENALLNGQTENAREILALGGQFFPTSTKIRDMLDRIEQTEKENR